MLRYLLMLGICVVASTGMGFVLRWFFRRLRSIEKLFWGARAAAREVPSLRLGKKGTTAPTAGWHRRDESERP